MLDLIKGLPREVEITINSKKRVLTDYKVHYVADKYYNIGVIEIDNIYNNPIKIYNAERCICDMLKSDEFDLDLRNKILHNYFNSSDKNIDRLLEYSKVFNVYEKVRTLVDYVVRWEVIKMNIFEMITDEKEKTEIINEMKKITDYKSFVLNNRVFSYEVQDFIKEIINKYRYKVEVIYFYNSSNGKDNIDCNQYDTLSTLEQMIIQYITIKYTKKKGTSKDE